MTHVKRGRKSKPYRTSWGEVIDGLARKPDGRWRIIATRYDFREADERIAVARFKQWKAQHQPGDVALPLIADSAEQALMNMERGHVTIRAVRDADGFTPVGPAEITVPLPESSLWSWLRKQLLDCPQHIADKVGIPQLASLADMPLPRESIRLSALISAYKGHATTKPATKRKAEAAWDEMVAATGAATLRELSTEKLLAHADATRRRLPSADSVATHFAKIKAVISFGLRRGMDAAEVRSALDRAAVLTPPKRTNKYTPSPISREAFAALLEVANDLQAALLLFALNACMYVSEVLSVDWEEIDLDRGTYLADTGREKTNVIRAATLWPRTIAALRKLPPSPGAVFKSSRGDRYHPNSFRKIFAALRRAAKVPPTLEFNFIRDGAFTATCSSGIDSRLADVVAGHASGMSDHYVARNPAMVRPACDAIERAYFGPQ